jgi:cytochrome c oxidase subunit 3
MKNINIKKNQFQAFPYHLVDPSPWPILVAFSVFSMAIGAVMYMHGFSNGGLLLNLGFIITVYGMILWFRDVISEGTLLGFHTKEVKNGLMIGFILFVISEVFAFFSIFWAFFHSSLSPAIEIGGNWPPLGITPLDAFAIPLLNTFLLLSSGAFVTYGHHALIAGNRKGAIIGTFLTVVFAIIFTLLQYYEYSEAAFTMSDSVYGSAFYASTGLHGLTFIVPNKFIKHNTLRVYRSNKTFNNKFNEQYYVLRTNKKEFKNDLDKRLKHDSKFCYQVLPLI